MSAPVADGNGDGDLAVQFASTGAPMSLAELRPALPLLDQIPFAVLWIGTGHELRWANRAALDLAGGSKRPLCFQQLHGYDGPCVEHAMECPAQQAQACGRAASTTHVTAGSGSATVARVVAVPVADGSTVEMMIPLPRPLSEDRLTGLLPRQLGGPLVERTFELMRRLQRPVALLLVDLDFFKQVNDRHGHAAGDRVLTAVGGVLRGFSRRTDIPIRWGGEEFLLVLPGIDRVAAAAVAEKIRRAIGTLEVSAGTARLSVTASIGIWAGGAGTAASDAVNCADQALLEAKRTGRDRCVIAPEPRAEGPGA